MGCLLQRAYGHSLLIVLDRKQFVLGFSWRLVFGIWTTVRFCPIFFRRSPTEVKLLQLPKTDTVSTRFLKNLNGKKRSIHDKLKSLWSGTELISITLEFRCKKSEDVFLTHLKELFKYKILVRFYLQTSNSRFASIHLKHSVYLWNYHNHAAYVYTQR